MRQRVINYWTQRSRDFGAVRRNELDNDLSRRWLSEILPHLPQGRTLDILDVGAGTGFFAVLLARQGHRVQGVDLTPAMLDEARALAREQGLSIVFRQMDAQDLDYPDECFDLVISRNLTWTLPDPERAYAQWHRVLRKGGVLLNYDADYASHVRSESTQNAVVAPDSPYGHTGMTGALIRENAAITLAMPISRRRRPDWDREALLRVGFARCTVDCGVGRRVLGELDLKTAPLFGIRAEKALDQGKEPL